MQETIADIQKRLRQGEYKNEEHVRLSLVARIVQTLGWNIWNPSEVNTEFIAIPHEDKTRVDMALFLPPWDIPSVFIEIKAVGKLQNLVEIERQTRDYNRNNTAPISVITDGQYWKLYLSQTGGEFSQKRFLDLDLLEDRPEEDFEVEFFRFLSLSKIKSGEALQQAMQYLSRTRREQLIFEVYPLAMIAADRFPDTSKAEQLVKHVVERGEVISIEEAVKFIKQVSSRNTEIIPPPVAPTPATTTARHSQVIESVQGEKVQFRNYGKKIDATAERLSGNKIRVFKGSRATLEETPEFRNNSKGYGPLRKSLIERGLLIRSGESMQLTQDYVFDSPSAAASVFKGQSESGTRAWQKK